MKANSFSSYAHPSPEIIKIILNKQKSPSLKNHLWKTAKTSWKTVEEKTVGKL